ncbi:urokinase plasminogen activator surface receptor-like isoform X3 [Simochromis diagramma]|uniref:urokinase plasminogen activator surface receptor-like isoform X3 n=1 Tax=Simochromis diagramma TaxID=43689 RepID=UPI001A7E67FD|nr:urokinase plasminogen activator surface receptor-like isoform X3 [Simochromis diagramma]
MIAYLEHLEAALRQEIVLRPVVQAELIQKWVFWKINVCGEPVLHLISGSVNLGFSQAVINTMCCTSDLCNSQDVPDWSISSPNGKKCFQCDGKDCTKTLSCNGNEDYCISAAVKAGGTTTKVKGCASKTICSNSATQQLSTVIGGEISCCQGDLCNRASSTTAHLLLFVAPLISSVFFS